MAKFIGVQPIEKEILEQLLEEIEFESIADPYKIEAILIEKGLEIHWNGQQIIIAYDCTTTYARALALIKEALVKKENGEIQRLETIKQMPKFESLGVMLDCSRNAVVKVETVKKFLRYLALMGYKTLQLYTEDTYELENYPYFGYMRGAYKKEEIEEIVNYSNKLGIEVIPCIQTLAHLGATLRWRAFNEVMDCENILLVGEEKTYEFIEAMIKHAAMHFTSKRINIGMDEAHNLGLGKYLKQHGYRERIEIMVEHLQKVVAICHKYDMKPMMWSDMFFRLLSGSGDYDEHCDLGKSKVLEMLPKDIEIIYWDYYNKEESYYDNILTQHKKLPNQTLFAGGAWRWRGVVPDNTFSLYVSEQALRACLKHQIPEIFVTAWGDNGGECATFAILPNLVYYAERCYEEVLTEECLKSRFMTFTGATWEDFILLDEANHLPDNKGPGRCSVNPSKYLFFQDVLLGLFDKHVVLGETNQFYSELSKKLEEACARNTKWQYFFEPIYLNAKILAIKAEMGVCLQKGYKENDLETIKTCIGQLETLIEDVPLYHKAIRKQWIMENKMSGLEVQDQRMGGMLVRLQLIKEQLESYVSGELDRIEELEYERLRFDCDNRSDAPISIPGAWWHEIITPNRIGRT